jgi:hypothetical protein
MILSSFVASAMNILALVVMDLTFVERKQVGNEIWERSGGHTSNMVDALRMLQQNSDTFSAHVRGVLLHGGTLFIERIAAL